MESSPDVSTQASTSAQPVAGSSPRSWSHRAVPQKSILKRPPPPSKSFFNLGGLTRDIFPGSLSKFIPAANPSNDIPHSAPSNQTAFKSPTASNGPFSPAASYDDTTTSPRASVRDTPLKRAHFILPHLSTVYSFSANTAPSSAELTEARLEFEDKARQQRKKEGAGAWSLGRVEEFYRESCRLRDELPLGGIIGALRVRVNVHRPK